MKYLKYIENKFKTDVSLHLIPKYRKLIIYITVKLWHAEWKYQTNEKKSILNRIPSISSHKTTVLLSILLMVEYIAYTSPLINEIIAKYDVLCTIRPFSYYQTWSIQHNNHKIPLNTVTNNVNTSIIVLQQLLWCYLFYIW